MYKTAHVSAFYKFIGHYHAIHYIKLKYVYREILFILSFFSTRFIRSFLPSQGTANLTKILFFELWFKSSIILCYNCCTPIVHTQTRSVCNAVVVLRRLLSSDYTTYIQRYNKTVLWKP